MNPEMLLHFLLENGIIDETQSAELHDEQSRSGKTIEEVVANNGVIQLSDLYQLIAQAQPEDIAVGISTSGGSRNIATASSASRALSRPFCFKMSCWLASARKASFKASTC